VGKLHTALLTLCAAAVLACAGLSVPLLARSEPESCHACPVADPDALPSPTTSPPGTREPGPPQCLVGSWRTVDENMMFKFYTDIDPFPFAASGRYYEFHADGTVVERDDNVQIVGHYGGDEQRIVANGWRQFNWSATGNTITYHGVTGADLTWTDYDHRGQLSSAREELDPNFTETNNYTCAGTQVVETNPDGFRSVWTRTADYGMYG
jgi:hypothetical protein